MFPDVVEASRVHNDQVGPRFPGDGLLVVPPEHSIGGQVELRQEVVAPHRRLLGLLLLRA
eukprot:5186129-Alexandrium_andersonii.AAC.1